MAYALQHCIGCAMLCIVIAMVCDFFDGKVARWFNAVSETGMYLDAISDFVSFGVAPAVLWIAVNQPGRTPVALFVACMYVLCGFYRLFRYVRTHKDTKETASFTGLPIPAAAGIIVGYSIASYYGKPVGGSFFSLSLLVTAAFLMVSRLPYYHFGYLIAQKDRRKLAVLLGVCGIGIVYFGAALSVFIIFMTYTLGGINWQRLREEPEVELVK